MPADESDAAKRQATAVAVLLARVPLPAELPLPDSNWVPCPPQESGPHDIY